MRHDITRKALSAIRSYPVTSGIIAVAAALFLATNAYRHIYPDDASEADRVFGASGTLMIYRSVPGTGTQEAIRELNGHFDLWEGELWRIPLSGFHHANLLHIVFNCIAIGFMGRLLEPRMSRLGYLAFFLLGTTISLIPEFLVENDVVGLSGGAYAMFGALVVLRQHDDEVAWWFHDGVVRMGLVWLVLCVPLTLTDTLRVANAAHFSGFAYGLLTGVFVFGKLSGRPWWRRGFLVGHLLILPALYLIMHPFWIGRYYWYVSRETANNAERIRYLRQAVALDSTLSEPWGLLATNEWGQGDSQAAWETILNGLAHNRTDEELAELARRIVRSLQWSGEMDEARRRLAQVFPDEKEAWEQRLGINDAEAVGMFPAAADPFAESVDRGDEGALDPYRDGINLPAAIDDGDEVRESGLSAPPVDPDSPDSAVAGEQI